MSKQNKTGHKATTAAKSAASTYSDETLAMIDEFAAKRGITRGEVIARFERLFAGRGPGKGAKVFFGQ